MKRLCAASLAALGLSAASALAENLKGNIWDVSPLVVEGVLVALTPETRIERRGQSRRLAPDELEIGWSVRVVGERGADERWTARSIYVETRLHEKVRLRGRIDALSAAGLDVGGERVLWDGVERDAVRLGLHLEGVGRRRDDGAVKLERFELSERPRDPERTKLLALAILERDEMDEHLSFHEDILFEDFLDRIGKRLAPAWAESDALRWRFRVVDDPEINVFACPDGSVYVHSGLLAALDNEAQLAAVLGHAIAHVAHEHAYRDREPRETRELRTLGSVVSASSIDVRASTRSWEGPSWARSLAEMGATACLDGALRGYGDELEAAADRIGLGYALAAGYDPFEAPAAWELLGRHASMRTAPSPWFLGSGSAQRARVGALLPKLNRDYRGVVEGDALARNEERYGRSVAALRRLNAAMDDARGEYRSAEAILRQVLARDAGDSIAHFYLGKVLWEIEGSEGADEALGELRLASELSPGLAEPYREMGNIYAHLGFRESAAAAFARYLEMAPSAPDALEVQTRARELR